jgi:electron transfer flavoprotein alpha subunit
MARNVLVVGELAGGAVSTTTAELLGAATRLAGGGPVSVTLLGSGASGAAAGAYAAGAGRVFASSDAAYDDFRPDQWMAAIEAATGQANPDLVLIAQSVVGRDIGPRLAFRRDTAVAMDCIAVEDVGGQIKATRPCYGGNANATYAFASAPAIATVRAKAMEPNAPNASASGELVELPAAGASRSEILGHEAAVAEGLQLQDAPIVVSGGRGLGSPEGFRLVEALADAIGRNTWPAVAARRRSWPSTGMPKRTSSRLPATASWGTTRKCCRR